MRYKSGQCACALLVLAMAVEGGVHYSSSCQSDEVQGEVLGTTGLACAPRCRVDTYDCPNDPPDGATAKAQCVLQDINKVAYCALLCEMDAQCPNGASCKNAGDAEQAVSICIHPLSFAQWAKPGRTKLVVGWPAQAGQSTRGFQIAKAHAALQNLKRRYGIADGDVDVLVVRELLSAAATGAAPPQATAASSAPAPSLQAAEGGVLAPFKHDLSQFRGYVREGLPGLKHEARDIIWKIEHLDRRGDATDLLRGVLMCAAVYLVVGCLYKYQTRGAGGIDMIPHIGFWMEYPQLVLDGINYSRALLRELSGLPKGASSFQAVGGTSARDTFAHFEPSKTGHADLL
mmetsp:Transcript_89966/g.192933  ORF Transcript_89966/g.192933 Transcript_89966/m.192933 type:complete len:345 (+) Transcript_89966:74-1108(+)